MTQPQHPEPASTATQSAAPDPRTASMPWPQDPIPEILARVETLTPLLPLVEPGTHAADYLRDQLSRDLCVLSEMDNFGLLLGPVRARFLTVLAPATN